MKTNGPFKITSSEVKYKNPWIEVREDRVVRPDGSEGVFGTVDYGKGISVVALDADHNIHLVKEYLYVLEEYGVQTPSGGIDGEETALEAARRELLEELGLTSDKWEELGVTNALTMIIKHPSYLFLALDVKIRRDPESGIEHAIMPFKEAHQMVLDSKITHGPSCVAILKTAEYLRRSS